jgi:peptidoglycan-N-acetylmuramic acid deacetylase
MNWKKWLKTLLIAAVLVFGLAQAEGFLAARRARAIISASVETTPSPSPSPTPPSTHTPTPTAMTSDDPTPQEPTQTQISEPTQQPAQTSTDAPETASTPSPTPTNTPTPTPTQTPESSLSNTTHSFSYTPNTDELRPPHHAPFGIARYNAFHLGAEGDKTLYLTFDEGYETGLTTVFLDILKEKNVKATFFVTGLYVNANPALMKRMADEGHAVASHGFNHLSSPGLTDGELIFEITEPSRLFRELTGKDAVKAFRPPMGEFSERTLAVTQEIGYKTVFWSFAYRDWITDDQPTREYAFNRITSELHDGAIILLHAVSSTNAEVLADVIDYCFRMGYNFRTLEHFK